MFFYYSLATTPQKILLGIAVERFRIKVCAVLE